MLETFSQYEASLGEFLTHPSIENRGARIQIERYRRDRIDFIARTYPKSCQNHESLLALIERFCTEHELQSEDYGHWGELTRFVYFLAQQPISYDLKSEIYFYTAAIAAQQLEGLQQRPTQIPFLASFLQIFLQKDDAVFLSSHGFLAKNYNQEGLTKVTSHDGKIRISRSTNDLGRMSTADSARKILSLADRHAWKIPSDRLMQIETSSHFENFFGTSEVECVGLYNSRCADAENARLPYPDFAKILFPVWKPESLGLTITYRCNATCGHCYNASGPNRDAHCIQWADISEQMKQWAALGVDEIGISGGEPFLYPEKVIETVRGLRDLGIQRIVPFSNGFWGQDSAQAESILLRLKEAGFGENAGDQIKISVGEFHQKDISIDHVFTLCSLHFKIIGRKVLLDVEQIQDHEMVRKLIFFAKERKVHDLIEWKLRTQISDSGRGKKIFASLEKQTFNYSSISCPVKNRGALYPEGDWIYCTGTIHPKRHLKMGTLKDSSIYELLSSAQASEKTLYLQFGSFADYLSTQGHKNNLPTLLPSGATPCSVCRQVFGKESSCA